MVWEEVKFSKLKKFYFYSSILIILLIIFSLVIAVLLEISPVNIDSRHSDNFGDLIMPLIILLIPIIYFNFITKKIINLSNYNFLIILSNIVSVIAISIGIFITYYSTTISFIGFYYPNVNTNSWIPFLSMQNYIVQIFFFAILNLGLYFSVLLSIIGYFLAKRSKL